MRQLTGIVVRCKLKGSHHSSPALQSRHDERVTDTHDNRTQDDPLAAVRSEHGCFGCGSENPIGLRLRFSSEGDGVTACFVPGVDHQGFDGVVHGGIICTVLDEAMAWATASAGLWAMTGEIRTRFRRPLQAGDETIVRGRITSQRGRVIYTAAELRLVDGTTIAAATGKFIRVSSEQERLWRSQYLETSS
jgi:acyl-coenzyme A thioesterase PaaI-like protein